MNLENNLYGRIEFTNRRKRGVIQPRYHCINFNGICDDDPFSGTGIGRSKFVYSEPYPNPSPLKVPTPWEIKDEWYSPVLKPLTPSEEPWTPLPLVNLHKDFEGSSWGKSFEPTDLLTSETPLGTLHIHCTDYGLVTGAKLFGEDGEKKISNYEASILDLSSWNKHKKKGFGEW